MVNNKSILLISSQTYSLLQWIQSGKCLASIPIYKVVIKYMENIWHLAGFLEEISDNQSLFDLWPADLIG